MYLIKLGVHPQARERYTLKIIRIHRTIIFYENERKPEIRKPMEVAPTFEAELVTVIIIMKRGKTLGPDNEKRRKKQMKNFLLFL